MKDEVIVVLNEKVQEQEKQTTALVERIHQLEANNAVLESHLEHICKSHDSQEQYSNCLCLRNDGIELPTNHSSESGMEILVKVKNIFDELDADIPVAAIDCTHRIGRKTMDANEKHKQHVIVRFTTWRHRTALYKARKKIKSVKFRLDLTKPRLNLLTSANNFLKNYKNFYAFADITFRMCAKIGNSFSFFDSISDLLSSIEMRSPLQVEDE